MDSFFSFSRIRLYFCFYWPFLYTVSLNTAYFIIYFNTVLLLYLIYYKLLLIYSRHSLLQSIYGCSFYHGCQLFANLYNFYRERDIKILHFVVLHKTVLHYVVLHYVALCYVLLHVALPLCSTVVVLLYVLLHVALCYVLLHVTLCYVLLHVALCYVLLHYVVFQLLKLGSRFLT